MNSILPEIAVYIACLVIGACLTAAWNWIRKRIKSPVLERMQRLEDTVRDNCEDMAVIKKTQFSQLFGIQALLEKAKNEEMNGTLDTALKQIIQDRREYEEFLSRR